MATATLNGALESGANAGRVAAALVSSQKKDESAAEQNKPSKRAAGLDSKTQVETDKSKVEDTERKEEVQQVQ